MATVNLPVASVKDAIPKLLHQTWKTTDVPERYKAFQKTFLQQHQSWQYKLWTDEDNDALIEEHYAWFLHVFRGYPHNIQRADAARYFILYHYGGVYADLDMQCLTPFDPLVEQVGGIILGQEGQQHANGTQRVGNAIILSSRHHPFWLSVFQSLMESSSRSDPLKIGSVFVTTGPSFLHEVYLKHPQGITVMPPVAFYPIQWHPPQEQIQLAERRQYPKSWAAHHWEGSWRNSPRTCVVEFSNTATDTNMSFTFVLPRKKVEGWGVIETTLFRGVLPREKLVSRWAELLQPGDTVIQACAYNGYLTLPLSHLVGVEGHVHAFEPDNRARSLLTETLRCNRVKNVMVYDCIPTSQNVRMYRINKVHPTKPHRMIWRAQQPNGVDCTMGTLIDAVLVERVTLIHIDVCGEESHVLYGADAIIKRDRPLLTMEIWNDARRQEYGCSVRQDQVFAVLERLGYYWELIDGSTYLCIPSEMDEHEEVMSFNHKPTPSALQPVHKMLRS